MAEHFIIYQGSRIFYYIIGNGKPVMLLHGFGEDGNTWKNQVEYLQHHFQLIIPDLPGSGKSEMINDMSIEGMAEVIKEIINIEMHKGTFKESAGIALLGHSMGGYITLAIAEKYPALLNSFGLVHSSTFADSEEKKINRQKSIAFIKTHGAYLFLKTSIPGLFLHPENNKACADLIEAGNNFTAESLVAYYIAMKNRPDRTAVLKTFNNPVLFIIGEHDKAAPFEDSMKQCYIPAQSHVNILRNTAHMGMWEEADKVNKAIEQFLQ